MTYLNTNSCSEFPNSSKHSKAPQKSKKSRFSPKNTPPYPTIFRFTRPCSPRNRIYTRLRGDGKGQYFFISWSGEYLSRLAKNSARLGCGLLERTMQGRTLAARSRNVVSYALWGSIQLHYGKLIFCPSWNVFSSVLPFRLYLTFRCFTTPYSGSNPIDSLSILKLEFSL